MTAPALTPAPTTTDTSDARCWADEGLATHVLVHGDCVTPLCAECAERARDVLAEYAPNDCECYVCGASPVPSGDLHIYPI